MQMKCEGAESPPCKRCEKVGRECLPQVTRLKGAPVVQSSPHRDNSVLVTGHPDKPSNSVVSISPAYLHETGSVQGTSASARSANLPRPADIPSRSLVDRFRISQAEKNNHSELPSIYSTSPVDAVNESTPYSTSPNTVGSVPNRKRKRYTTATISSDAGLSPATSCNGEILLAKDDIKEMIQL